MALSVQGLFVVHTHSFGDLSQSHGSKYSRISPKAMHQPSLCPDIHLLPRPLHLYFRKHLLVTTFETWPIRAHTVESISIVLPSSPTSFLSPCYFYCRVIYRNGALSPLLLPPWAGPPSSLQLPNWLLCCYKPQSILCNIVRSF